VRAAEAIKWCDHLKDVAVRTGVQFYELAEACKLAGQVGNYQFPELVAAKAAAFNVSMRDVALAMADVMGQSEKKILEWLMVERARRPLGALPQAPAPSKLRRCNDESLQLMAQAIRLSGKGKNSVFVELVLTEADRTGESFMAVVRRLVDEEARDGKVDSPEVSLDRLGRALDAMEAL